MESPVFRPITHPLCLFVLALVLTAPLAAEPIAFDADFDHGSLDVAATRVEGDTVHLVGRTNYQPDQWKWLYFRVDGVAGRELRFEIDDNFTPRSQRLRDWVPVYSYDNVRWHYFDRARWDEDAARYGFRRDEPFAGDTVWVALYLPYPVQRVADLVALLRWSEHVMPTASADERLVIGRSGGGEDDLGRTIPPQDLYGFVITDAAVDASAKRKVVLVGGVHANEVQANHVLEGLLLFLVSEQPEAAALRRQVAFHVYPMVNPDGRYAGYSRGGVQHPRRDTNRYWDAERYGDMDEIRTVAEAMVEDTGVRAGADDVDFLIDFHSWADTGAHFLFATPEAADSAFWRALREHEPEMEMRISRRPPDANRTTAWFGYNVLGAPHAITAETMFRPGEPMRRYHRMGRRFGKALHAHYAEQPPAADEDY